MVKLLKSESNRHYLYMGTVWPTVRPDHEKVVMEVGMCSVFVFQTCLGESAVVCTSLLGSVLQSSLCCLCESCTTPCSLACCACVVVKVILFQLHHAFVYTSMISFFIFSCKTPFQNTISSSYYNLTPTLLHS